MKCWPRKLATWSRRLNQPALVDAEPVVARPKRAASPQDAFGDQANSRRKRAKRGHIPAASPALPDGGLDVVASQTESARNAAVASSSWLDRTALRLRSGRTLRTLFKLMRAGLYHVGEAVCSGDALKPVRGLFAKLGGLDVLIIEAFSFRCDVAP